MILKGMRTYHMLGRHGCRTSSEHSHSTFFDGFFAHSFMFVHNNAQNNSDQNC